MTDRSPREPAQGTVIPVLAAISVSHLLNDTLQSLIPAIYPIVKQSFSLSFSQIGLITFMFQVTASLLQPVVGAVTDRRPQPFSLAAGMGFTLVGLVVLSEAGSFGMLLFSVALVGIGSSVFHPESSRVAHLAAGTRRGFAQSFFQVGGNAGSSLGPLLAALVIADRGRIEVLWFTILAAAGIVILTGVGRWYRSATRDAHAHAARGCRSGRSRATAGGELRRPSEFSWCSSSPSTSTSRESAAISRST